MVDFKIKWPREEPQWIDFQEDFVLFGDVEFIKEWEGADSPQLDSCLRDASNQQWHKLFPDRAAWFLGDMPGLLAPSTAHDVANESGKSVLMIWELIRAQDGFVMPHNDVLSSVVMDKPIYSATLETQRREFRIFPSCEPGESIMARRDLPVFYFGDGDSKLEVIPARLTARSYKGEFLIHQFSNGFDRCIWRA